MRREATKGRGTRRGRVVVVPAFDPAVPAEAFCYRCGKPTTWSARRPTDATGQRCEGCGDRFPCRHACQHLDCEAAREELASARQAARGRTADAGDVAAPASTEEAWAHAGGQR